jgi:acyl-coenzyme A synthetase/AMP-(fatty) acid ligase
MRGLTDVEAVPPFARDCGASWRSPLALAVPDWLGFATSGTTGAPVTWWRSRDQLLAEARFLGELLAVAESDVVVTQAPATHLYGYVTGSLLPAQAGLPVVSWRIGDPVPTGWRRPLVVAIPASWWGLSRSVSALRAFERVSVVHSTAMLPAAAASMCRRVPGLRLTELHGSTETGLVGFRTGAHPESGAAFTLAPDVSFAEMPDDRVAPLAVTGPRLAVRGDERAAQYEPAAKHTMDDLARVLSGDTYRLCGRTRLVKVNGRRVDVDVVERRLRSAVPGVSLACELVRHDIRGEWYDVLVAGEESDRHRVDAAARRLLPQPDTPRAVRRVSRLRGRRDAIVPGPWRMG